VVPALHLKKRNLAKLWVATVHFVVPPPSARWRAGPVRAILYYLNHRLGATLIRSGADLIVAVSETTRSEYVTKMGFDRKRIMSIPGGLDFDRIRQTAKAVARKEYDAIFMKRLHPMKGIFEVLEAWRQVVRVLPSAVLIMVGDGTPQIVSRIKDMIRRYDLGRNVVLKGPVYDQLEKVRLLAKSRVFLLPSLEENWALVIGEALTAGLPVIAYDLAEIRSIWKEHVVWVPKGDTSAFAKAAIEILQRGGTPSGPPAFLKHYDWKLVSNVIWERCRKMINRSNT
jgi:glycosyltransferase involved in cell wall biosynthesis